jgi:hypothetical protein
MNTQQEISDFLATNFPQSKCVVDAVGKGTATIRHKITEAELRPGRTVSGIVAQAVTTSLNFNFLRRPSADADILGVCKLLKMGKTLAVGEVSLYSEGDPEPVAHAVGTYAIPPGAVVRRPT